jgi:hypothetical protein
VSATKKPTPVADAMHTQLAKDVLTMAANGGMPDSYWYTDRRIKRALKVLGWTPAYGLQWAEQHKVDNS